MVAEKDPYIASAYQQLQVISQDKQKRLGYEAGEKAMRDNNQSMFEAEQRGRQEEAIMIAKNLISLGSDINFIAEATNLSIEQIQSLQKIKD